MRHKRLIHRNCHIRLCRLGKSRTALFEIRKERKLRDHQYCTVHLRERTVHLPRIIREHAQMNDLFRQMRCIGVRILRRNTKQNKIARSDLPMQHPINMDGCLLNTRDYCSQHITSFYQ